VRLVLDCGQMQHDELLVQVYFGPVNSRGEFIRAQTANLPCIKLDGSRATFEGSYSTSESGQHGMALRVLPYHRHVPNPIDVGLVLWIDHNGQQTNVQT
jgi:starch phosphorylase